MPAKSEAQQRLMGMALAAKRGKGHFSGKIKEIADSMSEKQLHDFAATKHEGLPEKKAFVVGFVKRASLYGFNEDEAIELLKSADATQPYNFIYPTAPVTPMAIQQPVVAPVAQKAPTGLDASDFKRIMGSYDPNSKMDRAKANVIQQNYHPGNSYQSIYKNPAYQAATRIHR